ncbi:abortive phage infection protein [Streptomyces sp. AN091965]|uniref:abortive phage infection protein n=1 Tax=Streptomyces sp. AN091965 TaxID=2927803 RepID=UPI001F620A5F|nr:abortive phage infection protein [Streptomyces sp. AN091965]MCI3928333.1 abortive phage infection protein [Streptomyces sp. AN091965]
MKRNEGMTRGGFLIGAAAAAGAAALAGPALAAAPAAAAPRPGTEPTATARRGLTYRGVMYECGDGDSPHTGWNARRMRADLRSIRRALHANSVVVYGTGVERMAATAAEAAEQGLHVWLQPRLGDVPERQILDHLAETGRQAERLRRQGARVYLSVGCEFVLFVPGIVPGDDALERVENMLKGNWDPEKAQRKLDRLIPLAARTGRRVFHGPVTYGGAHEDVVDWRLFDIVSVNYYSYFADPRGYYKELDPYRKWGKPVAITEFGTCTFRGAPEAGGMGWNSIDYSKPKPEVRPGLRRSERVQARYLTQVLDVFERMNLHAAMAYEFVSPEMPHRRERRYDLDMASYSLTKPIWRTEDDPTARWHWEPKESFHAVAEHYARAGRGA